jgi:ribosomal protein S18 acetylase RimI-like enzyme
MWRLGPIFGLCVALDGMSLTNYDWRISTRTLQIPPRIPLAHQRRCGPGHRRSGEPVIESLRLQLLAPADWKLLRDVRLEALLDSPDAFMSSHACESQRGESEWRGLFDAATWMVACDAEKIIGLATSVGEPGGCATRHVESVWVAPPYRRRGVCRALLRTLAEMDRRTGVTDLLLWVLEDNHDAQLAYEALGFEATGDRQFVPDLRRFERRMNLCITTSTGLVSGDSTSDEDAVDQAHKPAGVTDLGDIPVCRQADMPSPERCTAVRQGNG